MTSFEFKVDNDLPNLIGEYLSALANAACIHNQPKGYLVFGIEDKTHDVKGTSFDPETAKGKGNQPLKLWLANGLNPRVAFHVTQMTYQQATIVVFQVDAAFDRPVEFYGTAFIRIGESKTQLSHHPELERRIWNRRTQVDWSVQQCKGASFGDLAPEAIRKAREEYKKKFPAKAADVASWDDVTFLNKAKVTIRGMITNAAILLVGKEESGPLISPAVAKMSWFLKDGQNQNLDYEHFGPPFILNVDFLFARVRNSKYRHMPSGTLFPTETTKYDPWVIREALHNCIAHQDYGLTGRINVVETPGALIFTNVGSFLPGTVERVIMEDAPPEVYRNPFLAEAMVNLNMIDTQGGGIKKMYQTQMQRFFPLPAYDISDQNRVVVTIHGEILDERYSKLLMNKADLDLWRVILLDKVQKRIKISKEEARVLRSQRLIEGRYPNLHVSARIADLIEQKAQYLHTRGLDEQHYASLVIEHINKFGSITRKQADELLFPKLPEILHEKQKKNKVNRILAVKLKDRIKNIGSRSKSKYILNKDGESG